MYIFSYMYMKKKSKSLSFSLCIKKFQSLQVSLHISLSMDLMLNQSDGVLLETKGYIIKSLVIL